MSILTIIPGSLDLEFYGGDDVRFVARFKREVSPATDPITYEYYMPPGTPKAMIRPEPNCSTGWDLVVTKDETDPLDPFIVVSVPSEVSAAVVVDAPTVSQYIKDVLITAPMFIGNWDLQFDNAGDIRTYMFGKVTAIGEVTR